MATPIHGKGTLVLFDVTDLSQYLQDIQSGGTQDTAETTVFRSPNKTYVPGEPDRNFSITGNFDGGAGAIDQILAAAIGAAVDSVLSVGIGGAKLGQRTRLARVLAANYSIQNPVAGKVGITAAFQADAAVAGGEWLQSIDSPVTAAFNGVAVDDGAASSTGAIAHLHVITNTLNAGMTYKIQHSVDGSTAWADLVTFTVVGAGTQAAERQLVASGTTIRRFLRAVATGSPSSGTAAVAIALART